MLIKNGRVIDPASGLDGMLDIRVKGGIIAGIGSNLAPEGSEEILDAKGLIAAPGLVDTHAHFRDPGFTCKEDLHTGAQAAARGGYTSVVCMANTAPVADCESVLENIISRAGAEPLRIYQAAAVTIGLKGEALTDMDALKKAGAALFTDDGMPVRDSGLLFAAMERAASAGCVISLHEEDPALIRGPGINEGEVSGRLGLAGAPAVAEASMVARDCMLALATGARVIIQHISAAPSVEAVRFARSLGARVDAEATPHHFSLTEEAILSKGTLAKMNPPLRSEADRLAIIEGLKDGTISIIATDHAPHREDEKNKDFAQAPSGVIGLETALALGITNLVLPGHLTLTELISAMTVKPAQALGLEAGRLTVGAGADIVIFDPSRRWKVEGFASKSRNSPFLGDTLTGRVIHTVCGGRVVYTACNIAD
ncbi:MAG: dihydroorotase [Oscillospiraceae bacterium]|jgi:dihydroorotase|nr:dihydroorotase [Oscillospiraceae bacterium]